MAPSELLSRVARILEAMGIRYFVTGSMATILYGEPRLTNDVDMVVDLPYARIGEFCRQFPIEEFYVSEPSAHEAVRLHGQFNIIHPDSGLKVDVIVAADDSFNRSRFNRARRVAASQGVQAWFATPEDAIIKKMEYFREGGSEKHLRDITGVLKTSGNSIDLGYIAHWTQQLGLGEIWAEIQRQLQRKA